MNGVCRVDADGNKRWWLNGQLHRTDGPAYEGANGTRVWWLNGQLHRVDGPAYEGEDGTSGWWLNSLRHRTDGPAYEGSDGDRQWWLNDEQLTYDEFIVYTKHAFREAVIALLPLELPPYEMLALLEWAFPVLATPQHHRACIQLIMGMTESRRRIK